MTFGELLKICDIAKSNNKKHILLKLYRRNAPRGQTMRLALYGGPVGRYVSYLRDDWYLADFEVERVEAWVRRYLKKTDKLTNRDSPVGWCLPYSHLEELDGDETQT